MKSKLHSLTKKISSATCAGKMLALAASAFLLSENVTAQSFAIVGNGTTYNCSTCYPAPYGNYYWGSRTQQFVTAAELSAAGIVPGATISSVGFNIFSTNGANPHQAWTVTVYTTTLSDPLSAGYVTTGQVASSTPVTATGVNGWNQTTISPFIWNGVDNLVVLTCFANTNPGGYTYNYSTYWTTNLTGTSVKTRYNYQDVITSCPTSFEYTTTTSRHDMRFEWDIVPCSGTPDQNSVVSPTFMICPNSTVALGLANAYTVGGLTYQWKESTFPNGPFVPVSSNGNGVSFKTPSLTVDMYYQVEIACPNQGTLNSGVGSVSIAPTTTNSVPYYENFELIGLDDRLPNCSWTSSGPLAITRTYLGAETGNRIPNNGDGFASFTRVAGTHHYFTNGIWMEPGITYSAALWYTSDLTGMANWSDLSITVGTNQNPGTHTVVATTGGAAISPAYKSLSNTFTVGAAAFYHVGVKASSPATGSTYLSWDDLSVTIPCQIASNKPNLSLTQTSFTICRGNSINVTASGAATFTWSNGFQGPTLIASPFVSTSYGVTGTKGLTGCEASGIVYVTVNNAPSVGVFASPAIVCKGQPVTLQASGALMYSWNTGSPGSVITDIPQADKAYIVTGTDAMGCTGSNTVNVVVRNLPPVDVTIAREKVCAGDPVSIDASGANTYVWTTDANSNIYSGAQISVNPATVGTFTFEAAGTDANGCVGKKSVAMIVEACTGIRESNANNNTVTLFPNPAGSEFAVKSSENITSVEITDITGRVVLRSSNYEKINISGLSNGLYNVKVVTAKNTEVLKLIKD